MARLAFLLLAFSLFASASLFHPVSCGCLENKTVSLFIFGDSFFDVGNKKYISNAEHPHESCIPSQYWPYGRFFDKPNGRFSDGSIVPDYIGRFLELEPIPPFEEVKKVLPQGANFASAGAAVSCETKPEITLGEQVEKFEKLKSEWVAVADRSVILISIGAHDYLSHFRCKNQSIYNDPDIVVQNVVNDIIAKVYKLFQLGVRRFGFQNVGPLGLLPTVKQEANCTGQEPILNLLAMKHNEALKKMLEHLAEKIAHEEKDKGVLRYSILDFFGAIKRRVDNPSPYGLKEAEHACCGVGEYHAVGCALLDKKGCPAPSGFVFFDGVHNTQYVNEQLAHVFWEADNHVVYPQTLKELVADIKPFDLLEEY
ncbi:hypothetical protein SLEP1_g54575 [Rubroshorea leprosula]|uniref:GDSL esterase/lipase 1-like n=1 Tax=Rubroshorea leprosula TaxID=152421 RepID=A0AAV5MCW4_9ROSI|nr:hypothetical protein SLEP1_g54575 [Rubroshorea leprosula]